MGACRVLVVVDDYFCFDVLDLFTGYVGSAVELACGDALSAFQFGILPECGSVLFVQVKPSLRVSMFGVLG